MGFTFNQSNALTECYISCYLAHQLSNLYKLCLIPENIIVAFGMNNLGRKKTLVTSHSFLGILCIGLSFVPKEHSNIILVIYLLATMMAGMSM